MARHSSVLQRPTSSVEDTRVTRQVFIAERLAESSLGAPDAVLLRFEGQKEAHEWLRRLPGQPEAPEVTGEADDTQRAVVEKLRAKGHSLEAELRNTRVSPVRQG
ncbi:hypothetical protein [Actinomycetospora sp. CA-053990]|uniref:hypothetical protein n=1 Tax=Actinomycetospora sp. CA-053990 TaxID=3239891 RepID=UPI003D8C766A